MHTTPTSHTHTLSNEGALACPIFSSAMSFSDVIGQQQRNMLQLQQRQQHATTTTTTTMTTTCNYDYNYNHDSNMKCYN